MARLMASLCLAACLMVALPGCSAGESKEVQEIKAIWESANKEENPEQWEMLAKACAEILVDKKLLGKISSAEAVSIFNQLKYSLNRLPNLKAEDLKISRSWIDLLSLREETRECKDKSVQRIVQKANVRNHNRWQFEYVLDCFRDYLIRCSYEDLYQTVIKTIKEVSNRVYKPTLDSFIRSVFWTQFEHKDYLLLDKILMSFVDLYRIESDSDGQTCEIRTQRPKLIRLINRGLIYKTQFRQLAKDYFAVYLKKCGYEDRFRKAMTKNKASIVIGDPSLASYLWEYRSKNEYMIDSRYIECIFGAISTVDYMSGELTCNVHNRQQIRESLRFVDKCNFTKLFKGFRSSFANYLKGCAVEFKAKIRELVKNENEALLSIKGFKKQLETEFSEQLSTSEQPSRETVKKILNEHYPPDGERKIDDLRSQCDRLRNHIELFMDALSYEYNLTVEDDEIIKFLDDIGYCFYKEVDLKLKGTPILRMFDNLGAPYIPSKVQPKRPKRKFRFDWTKKTPRSLTD